MTTLAGATVLVTGASSGIGAATARAMSRRGAQVLVVSRDRDKLEALVRELGNGAAAYPCDAGDHRAVAVMADLVETEHGVPDVIVNSAGAGRWLSIEDTDPEEFLEMVAVPYLAAFFVTRAFIAGMLARGSGWVVNVDSPASQIPLPGAVGYTSARGALRGFDAALHADLRRSGVGVTHMVPAKVSSGYFQHNPGSEERIPGIARLAPTLTPDQVAEEICQAVERERREVIAPFMLRVFFWSERFMPRLTEWVVWRTGARRKPSRSRLEGQHPLDNLGLVIALPEARKALSQAAHRLADLLCSLPDTEATIPRSTWTVGDAAAHVVMNLRREALVAAGEAVPWATGATDAPGTPRGIEELNARAVAAEAERHPRALASMLVTAVEDFLSATAKLSPDHPMPSPYFQGEMALDLAGVTSIELGELLVHGYDIAKTTERPWPMAAADACLALPAALRLAPAAVNPHTARGHTGAYELRVRGGPRVVIRFADGNPWLEEPGRAPVDCHILAEPVPLLLVLYARVPQWGPITKGQLLTWGRRPWRALGFKRLFLSP